ncbi:WD40/YVTN/BNR-like repeat-containing protein [Bryobacter aggregatus]|uniref:WD40/YVTN/BNR-like repeat-containing protein n=1 Tax=Bryobacter aggregatus TaxID=360054 RepID=UPI000569AB06|nr:hypothetical protein [Bryobacter aggregatus]
MRRGALLLTVFLPDLLHAQWTMQKSPAVASLRGIHNVGKGVAWASGTNGTVLNTRDDGESWKACAIPPGAEQLDFRSVQAFDAKTAIVMSSGKGDLSRVYQTTDGCQTWSLLFTNPDPEGFWDAIRFENRRTGVLIGDPVGDFFTIFWTTDGGRTWKRFREAGVRVTSSKQSIFAASNSALLIDAGRLYFVTGGGATALFAVVLDARCTGCQPIAATHPPLATGETAGGFSLAMRREGKRLILVAVGGDYKVPEARDGTAATWTDGHWTASGVSPGGYRSAVAYVPEIQAWLAVGPTGTDRSQDEGRNWRAVGSESSEDKGWNALSFPFVVGVNGKIGKWENRKRLRQ